VAVCFVGEQARLPTGPASSGSEAEHALLFHHGILPVGHVLESENAHTVNTLKSVQESCLSA
jgi:hypothetical protein